MVVEPAAGDLGEPVEPGNARLREEAGEHVADDAAHSVRGEDLRRDRTELASEVCRDDTGTHIKTVVVAEDELELCGEIAERAGHEAEQDSGGCMHGSANVQVTLGHGEDVREPT